MPVDPTVILGAEDVIVQLPPNVHGTLFTVTVGLTRSLLVTSPGAVNEPVTVGVAIVGDVANTALPEPVEPICPSSPLLFVRILLVAVGDTVVVPIVIPPFTSGLTIVPLMLYWNGIGEAPPAAPNESIPTLPVASGEKQRK